MCYYVRTILATSIFIASFVMFVLFICVESYWRRQEHTGLVRLIELATLALHNQRPNDNEESMRLNEERRTWERGEVIIETDEERDERFRGIVGASKEDDTYGDIV